MAKKSATPKTASTAPSNNKSGAKSDKKPTNAAGAATDSTDDSTASYDVGACCLCHCSFDFTDRAAFFPKDREEDYSDCRDTVVADEPGKEITKDNNNNDDNNGDQKNDDVGRNEDGQCNRDSILETETEKDGNKKEVDCVENGKNLADNAAVNGKIGDNTTNDSAEKKSDEKATTDDVEMVPADGDNSAKHVKVADAKIEEEDVKSKEIKSTSKKEEKGDADESSYFFRRDDPYLPELLYDPENALVYCDNCDRLFHQKCHFVPLLQVPKGEWHCLICTTGLTADNKKSKSKLTQKTAKKKNNRKSEENFPAFYPENIFKSPPVTAV